MWTIYTRPATTGPATTVIGQNNRLEITIGGRYMDMAVPESGGALVYNSSVTGNFMSTVDFSLLNWDPIVSRGVRVALIAKPMGGVERIGDPNFGGNSYLVDFMEMGGSIAGITPATTLNGSLMLIRYEDMLRGYYMDSTTNGYWHQISAQENQYLGDLSYFALYSWAASDSSIGRQIAFDNFTITDTFTLPPGTSPVPEPSSLLLMSSGLPVLMGIGRRRMKKYYR